MSDDNNKKLRILFHPIETAGHVYACIGLAQHLQDLGHEIIFLVDYALKKKFAPYGFTERYVHQVSAHQPDGRDPSERLGKSLLEVGILSDLPPLEKLVRCRPFLKSMADHCDDYDKQVVANLAIERPDLIVVDNLVIEPAILQSNIPMISLYSGNPLPLYQTNRLPPFGLGLPTTTDSGQLVEAYDQVKEIFYDPVKKLQASLLGDNTINRQTITTEASLLPLSKHLTIYGYPLELDYDDIVPRPETLFRLDNFCRKASEESVQLPEKFLREKDKKLIYFSLGTMGTADEQLLARLVGILGTTNHNYIVSMGPSQLALPDNMFGARTWPQVDVLPLVDLVICHGGNNTITETVTAGKPLIVLPLFSDGYDNAQRVAEKHLGTRLDPYNCTADQLVSAIDHLLTDNEVNTRLREISTRIKQDSATLVEQLSRRLISIAATAKRM